MVDIVKQIKEYSIKDVILTETGINTSTRKNTKCPICGGGVKTGCFKVYGSNTYSCFSCGSGGSAIDFVKDLHQTTAKEAINYISNKYLNIITDKKPNYKAFSKKIIKAKETELQAQTINDKEVNNKFIDIVKSLQRTVNSKEYQYLLKRGFDEVACKSYGFYWFDIKNYAEISKQLLEAFEIKRLIESGIFSEKGKLKFYKHRILIAYRHGNEIQHLQARSLPKETDKIKYLFSGGKRTVFNAQNLTKIDKNIKEIYFCEGAFDAVSIELLEKLDNRKVKAIALGSVNGNEKAIKHIVDFCIKENKYPVFAFDSDKVGIQAATKMSKSNLVSEMTKKGLLFTTATANGKDFNIELINRLNGKDFNTELGKKQNELIYNIDTDVFLSCKNWLNTLKINSFYSFKESFRESLNFLSEFDNCNFRIIENNRIIIIKE